MSKQVNYNENLVAGAAIRDDKGRRISKLFESPHPKMTVGYAKNLIMPDDPTEQEFNFRQSGGGLIEDGVAVIDKVKGNSVVWNQLIKDFREPSNWLTGGNDVTIVGDKIHIKFASASSSNSFGVKSSAFSAGHKYYIQMNNENAVPLTAIKLGSASSVGNSGSTLSTETPMITEAIPTSSYGDGAFWFWSSDETKLEGDFSNIFAIDLTQMFGAGNEPATVEEFLQRKPKVADEYAYNEGTIVNNKVEKVKTTGINLWDEQWELGAYNPSTGEKLASSNQIRSKNMFDCLPHTSYYWRIPNKANGTYMGFCYFYDISGTFISKSPVGPNAYLTVTTPSNARFVAFSLREEYGTIYNHDICINLSDPAINGQYFPYEEHTLDLSWVKDIKDAEGVKLFEDGIKSAGTAFDEVGKNKAVKRLGVKVLDGSDMYGAISDANYGSSTRFNLQSFKAKNDGMITNSYGFDNRVGVANAESIAFHGIHGYLILQIATSKASSVDELRTYLASHPLTIIYELAEPIEVEYDEKSLTYPVVAGGTEEAIASEPSTAFRADIGYGIDAVKTILDLKARVEALEGK